MSERKRFGNEKVLLDITFRFRLHYPIVVISIKLVPSLAALLLAATVLRNENLVRGVFLTVNDLGFRVVACVCARVSQESFVLSESLCLHPTCVYKCRAPEDMAGKQRAISTTSLYIHVESGNRQLVHTTKSERDEHDCGHVFGSLYSLMVRTEAYNCLRSLSFTRIVATDSTDMLQRSLVGISEG